MPDEMYISPHSRVVDHSSETEADGDGAYSFAFYEKGPDGQTKKQKNKKQGMEERLGNPVEVNLSSVAREELGDDANNEIPELPEDIDVNKKPPENGGHINITV